MTIWVNMSVYGYIYSLYLSLSASLSLPFMSMTFSKCHFFHLLVASLHYHSSTYWHRFISKRERLKGVEIKGKDHSDIKIVWINSENQWKGDTGFGLWRLEKYMTSKSWKMCNISVKPTIFYHQGSLSLLTDRSWLTRCDPFDETFPSVFGLICLLQSGRVNWEVGQWYH